jgi:hypothetical protein
MSTALASLKLKQTRSGQNPAGIGATLAYNEIIRDALPPIVAELENKILELQEKLDSIKRPSGTGISAVRGLQGGRHTRKKLRV